MIHDGDATDLIVAWILQIHVLTTNQERRLPDLYVTYESAQRVYQSISSLAETWHEYNCSPSVISPGHAARGK
jgi:hypothetical protein